MTVSKLESLIAEIDARSWGWSMHDYTACKSSPGAFIHLSSGKDCVKGDGDTPLAALEDAFMKAREIEGEIGT